MADPFNTAASPTMEPESIIAGSYVSWRKVLDYDDDLFVLKYRFIPVVSGTTQTITGMFSASSWVFEILSATSAAWASGEYRFDLLVERLSDSEQALVETGSITVFASSDDRRSHAAVMLTKIESLLTGRADADVESYSIKSRSITKMSIMELTKWRDYYATEVGRETAANRAKNNTIRVRFI